MKKRRVYPPPRAKALSKSTDYQHQLREFFTGASMLAIIFVFFSLLAGCMPIGDQEVNNELFKSKEELKAKTYALERGMSKEDAFATLNVPLERFSVMSTAQIQTAVYGNSIVQGNPIQLEKFRKRLTAYDGYSLPYRHIESTGSIGFGKMHVDRAGHDLRLILIFDQDKLMKASVIGEEEYRASEDKYIWNSLIDQGVGSVF